jgi:hypothetical protein
MQADTTQRPMPKRESPTLALRALVVLICLLVGAFVAAKDAWDGSLVCASNYTSCIPSSSPRLWLGRVYTPNGAPAAFATVYYSFASDPTLELDVSADRQGRYCIRWPIDTAAVSTVTHGPGGPPDAPYVALLKREHVRGPLIVSPDNPQLLSWGDNPGTGLISSNGWNAAIDETTQCTSASPPWYDVESLHSDWHYLLLILGPLAAFVLAIVGVARRRGLALSLAALAMTAALFFLCQSFWAGAYITLGP